MKRIVVLTGAGISAESGIKTFRDSDGLWENYRVEDVATYEAWKRNPDLVRDFYNQRRRELYNVQPNEGHKQLVRLESRFHVDVITQNIDDLHERAGSSNVLHLHGELKKVRSETDPFDIRELEGWELTEDMKDREGRPLNAPRDPTAPETGRVAYARPRERSALPRPFFAVQTRAASQKQRGHACVVAQPEFPADRVPRGAVERRNATCR